MIPIIFRPRFLRLLALLLLLLAGASVAQAQRTELMITVGSNLNSSNVRYASSGPNLNYQFGIKAGRVFPSRTGVGLVYEVAKFTSDIIYPADGSTPVPLYFTEDVANPQHFFGAEVYRKFFVSERSYIRLGGVIGYALANRFGGANSSVDLNLGGGLDVSYLFPLARRLSGVVNTGLRYYSVQYGSKSFKTITQTISVPFTIGFNYKFASTHQQQFNDREE